MGNAIFFVVGVYRLSRIRRFAGGRARFLRGSVSRRCGLGIFGSFGSLGMCISCGVSYLGSGLISDSGSNSGSGRGSGS